MTGTDYVPEWSTKTFLFASNSLQDNGRCKLVSIPSRQKLSEISVSGMISLPKLEAWIVIFLDLPKSIDLLTSDSAWLTTKLTSAPGRPELAAR
jgi:hypothetical protein